MNYLIEILRDDEVIATKKTYTLEEIREFYLNEFRDYCYRIYKLETYINIYE